MTLCGQALIKEGALNDRHHYADNFGATQSGLDCHRGAYILLNTALLS
jgi:hypothetical protein